MSLLAGMVRFFGAEVEIVEIPAWDCLPATSISPICRHHGRAPARPGPPGGRSRQAQTPGAHHRQRHGAEGPPPERVRCGASAGTGRRPLRSRRDDRLPRAQRLHRTSAVVEAGDYAVRGGLVDVFPSGLGAARPAGFLRLDAGVDPHLRSADATLCSQARFTGPDAGERGAARRGGDESFRTGYLRQFGAVTGDPLQEAVATGRAFPGMEHWLPLFHRDLVPITAYLDEEGEIGLDQQTREALSRPCRADWGALRGAAAAATGWYQLRRHSLPSATAGAALSRR